MSVTKTNVFMDIVACTFTPTVGGSAVTFGELTAADPGLRGTKKQFSGGASQGPRVKKIVAKERTVTLRGADLFQALSVPQGVLGSLVFTINDLYNAASTGAITVTLANCSMDEVGIQQEHNEIGKYTLTFSSVWLDGTTDPLTVTQTA